MNIFSLKKRWYVVAVVVIWILFRIITGFFRGEEYEEFVVSLNDLTQETRVVGDVIAQNEALLGFGATGRITNIYFEVGDYVEEGQLIAEIDPQAASAEYSLAAANVSREQAELNDLLDGNRSEEIAIEQNLYSVQKETTEATRQELFQEVLSARTIAEDAVRLKTDIFFRDPEGYARMDLAADLDTRKFLEEERRDYGLLFKKWTEFTSQLTLESLDTSDIDYTIERLERIKVYLNNLTLVVAESGTNDYSNASIQNLASARTAVEEQIDTVQNSLTSYNKSLAELARQESELNLTLAGASAGEIATQRARLEAERAQLRRASSTLFDTRIVAPFSGTITEKLYEQGETVSGGTGVVGVATLESLEIQSFIPEVFIGDVTVDDQAFVMLDAYPNQTFEAKVISVDPKQTDRDGLATYKTTLILTEDTNITLRLGMTADITIVTSERESVPAVPLSYIIFEDQKTYVNKKEGEEFVKIPVRLGIIDPEGLQEVLEGVQEGDLIKKE